MYDVMYLYSHYIYVGQKIGHIKENREIDNNFSLYNFAVTVVGKYVYKYIYISITVIMCM